MHIYEPGLESLVVSAYDQGQLQFTTNAQEAVEDSEIIFIAVGTPPDEDGSADLTHVLEVAETIGMHMNAAKLVVNKSTVPVGTADKVEAIHNNVLARSGLLVLNEYLVAGRVDLEIELDGRNRTR